MTMTVSGAHRRRVVQDEETFTGGGGSAPAGSPPTTPSPNHDRALGDAVRNAATKPSGDGILYVGLNQGSNGTELAALQAATGGQVTAVMSHAGGKVDTKFGDFDLAKPGEVARFCTGMVAHYGLTAAQGKGLEKLLGSVPEDGKDEVARMALVFARAESGGTPMPSRLVLSGHSGGDFIFGQAPGSLATSKRVAGFDFEQIRQLGEIMPRAASQIEDIHFAGCNTYHQVKEGLSDKWQKAFPNVRTLWSYNGSSDTAPVGDLRGWEARTRGRADTLTYGSLVPFDRGSEGHIYAWSKKGDTVNASRLTIAAARSERDRANTRLADYVSGDRAVHDSHDSKALDDYQAYNNLATHPNVSAAESAQAVASAKVMLRVRFYEERVRGQFQRAHGAEIGRAFEALGMSAPDFSKLTRKEAMERVAEFRKVAGTPPRADIASASRHLEGLAALDPNVIDESWVS